MSYLPIESYGIIGDMRTVALVGMNGSIDWFCFPHFDSPSVFATILDHKKGGHFKISPAEKEITQRQLYRPWVERPNEGVVFNSSVSTSSSHPQYG